MRGLFGDMARLPWRVMLFAARQVVETMERWSPAEVGPADRDGPPGPRFGGAGGTTTETWDRNEQSTRPVAPPAPPATDKEDRIVADTNLNDDDVKLVQFAIVSIERREEELLTPPSYHLEKGRTDDRAFASSRIADWVKEHPERAKKLDLDQLRVYFEVLARWPKADLKFEEKSLDIEEEKLGYLRKMVGQS